MGADGGHSKGGHGLKRDVVPQKKVMESLAIVVFKTGVYYKY
jgi:hypothetical protein